MEFDEVLGTVFVVGLVAPFVLVPIKMALCGDRENKVRGWIWNREGWKDPDYKLIEKLEQWELFYRAGCYFSSEKCDHVNQCERVLDYYRKMVYEEKKELLGGRKYTGDYEYALERLSEEEGRQVAECVTLDEELARFRFDALEAHTKHVGTMITEGKKWTSG